MELKRVVVTGLGAVTPLGNTPEETWKNMLAGEEWCCSYYIISIQALVQDKVWRCEVKRP